MHSLARAAAVYEPPGPPPITRTVAFDGYRAEDRSHFTRDEGFRGRERTTVEVMLVGGMLVNREEAAESTFCCTSGLF